MTDGGTDGEGETDRVDDRTDGRGAAAAADAEPRPCVVVPRTAGETTRQALAEADLLAAGYAITTDADGDRLFLPVTDADRARAAGHEVVVRPTPTRAGQTMPADLLETAPSYERIGDTVLIDEDDPDRARAVADAVLESDLPVDSVLNRASEVRGEERVREWDVLAGDTTVVHREYGVELAVDLAAAYFSPRLATERHRVIEQVTADERALDMFAGVGPFAVAMAVAGATVVGVDVNADAIAFLRENARRNGVADRVTAIHGDVRDLTGYDDWADRLVMNLPHSAQRFLDVATRLAGPDCVLHYYDIQPEPEPFAPGERVLREAATAAGYEATVLTRRRVRSYAPGETNVVLDVRLRDR